MWLGSGTVRPCPRCSGLNNHVNFDVCLFLIGDCEVAEPSDTSTATGGRLTRSDCTSHESDNKTNIDISLHDN